MNDVVQIPLTQGKVAVVDAADAPLVLPYRWQALHNKHVWYATRYERRLDGGRGTIYMHRVIVQAVDGELVDHRDEDGLNNRRDNLRTCTRAQNNQHRREFRPSLSPYRGVAWDKQRQRWIARISINNHDRRIGRFTNELDAARAYDGAAQAHYGEFAVLNFPSALPPRAGEAPHG